MIITPDAHGNSVMNIEFKNFNQLQNVAYCQRD